MPETYRSDALNLHPTCVTRNALIQRGSALVTNVALMQRVDYPAQATLIGTLPEVKVASLHTELRQMDTYELRASSQNERF
jgi:hypothetical protein